MAVGRRKCAIARVRLVSGSGKIEINGKDGVGYFASESVLGYVKQVFDVVDAAGKFDVIARVVGGGITGQAGAVRLGIARALEKVDAELRPALKAAGMLTRDARVKERKKSGQPGARRRFQFSKR
ncbi:MAG: 30S ribosomal protein S9 [Victivallaceae bacterium]|nr:30S ribosomal protein S9 [Victivallaceae bacterium]